MEGEAVCRVEDFAGFGVDLGVEGEEGRDCVAEVRGVWREQDAVCCGRGCG